MLLAEAVIALTTGAVAELKVGIVLVRPAADRAFVLIKLRLLLVADTLGLLVEINGVGTGSSGHRAEKIAAAEDKEVDDSNNRQKI